MSALNLTTLAKEKGWSMAGVCSPEIPESTAELFQLWLKHYKGPQLHYLSQRQTERLNPKIYFPPVQSILCFGLYYFSGWAEGSLKISNYSWNIDYHVILKEKLEMTAEYLQKELGSFRYRSCVDTSPVLEKVFAVQAGLGWQGKNTLLLNRTCGSFLFLSELFTDLPLHSFKQQSVASNHCGSCTRCMDACPTHALKDTVLDAEKCIAYWNLEHRGSFQKSTPPFHTWVAGCDICQEVCPWNHKLTPLPLSPETEFMKNLSENDIEASSWPQKIQNKAVSYLPTEKWKQNLKHLALHKNEAHRRS